MGLLVIRGNILVSIILFNTAYKVPSTLSSFLDVPLVRRRRYASYLAPSPLYWLDVIYVVIYNNCKIVT